MDKESRFRRLQRELDAKRLGVVVMKQKTPHTTTTTMKSRDLFTHEEKSKILADALEKIVELHKAETFQADFRLRLMFVPDRAD